MIKQAAAQLSQVLGIPLYRSHWLFPDYPDGDMGSWRLAKTGVGLEPGYYTGQWVIAAMPLLLRRAAANPELWEPWMSLSPHEIESQEPGCLCARGHTVIMGLGMGLVAINAALNPAVDLVTVVELDKEVIRLFDSTGVLNQLPPQIAAKIWIVHGNAMEWQSDLPVDLLYADIWRPIADSNALADTRRMQANLQADKVYFWGQELRLFSSFIERFGQDTPLTLTGLQECAALDLQLPLLLPWGEDYPAMIETAVRNRQARGLPLEENA